MTDTMWDNAQGNAGSRKSVPTVAIIMRSKNEQPYAERTLEALGSQTFRAYALYNVDSGSTDGTLEAIKRFNSAPNRVVEIAPRDYVPGKVLNDMIARTDEQLIVFLNADAIPLDERWLENLLAPLLNGSADAAISRQVARADAHFIVKYDYERGYGDAAAGKRRHCFFSAVACAFRRELWEDEKFPEQGWGEDFVWAVRCREKGRRFELVLDSVVEHSHNYSLDVLYKREYGHGIVHYQTLAEKPAFFQTAFSLGKYLLRDAWHAIGSGRPDTIPYSAVYRTTFTWAHFQGRRAANAGRGFEDEFFRT